MGKRKSVCCNKIIQKIKARTSQIAKRLELLELFQQTNEEYTGYNNVLALQWSILFNFIVIPNIGKYRENKTLFIQRFCTMTLQNQELILDKYLL